MARKKKERKIGRTTAEQMKEALTFVTSSNLSLRKAAKQANIPYPTLRRYYMKKQKQQTVRLTPNYEVRKIFTAEQEAALCEYITRCAYAFYGLTNIDCRRIAYQMAKLNDIKIPESWVRDEIAGKEWLRSFRSRHPDITLRTPENCSLARASAFNRSNIEQFFENLHDVMARNERFADGTRVFNLDETATTTVQKHHKVLAPKGIRCLSKVTSGEKGTLVTTCCIVNATGSALPPIMIFPRVHFKIHMLNGSPSGTLGLANPSGWMNVHLFVEVMRHYIKHTSSSLENPSLLIFDNHESHLSIEVLDLAKSNGVTILTLPPHTSNKTQPLDVGVFSSFKQFYNAAMDSWMLRNPGQPVTIYEIGALVGEAHKKALTPTNIMSGFKRSGIFPFDRNIFSDDDFIPSSVTDRPEPSERPIYRNILENTQEMNNNVEALEVEEANVNTSSQSLDIEMSNYSDPIDDTASNKEKGASSSKTEETTPVASTSKPFLSPENFLPPLRAAPRKNTRRQRKKRKSIIATDTPEKNQIARAASNKKTKENKAVKSVTRKVLQESSSDSDISFKLRSDTESEDEDEENELRNKQVVINEDVDAGVQDFVLVEFKTKKSVVYYIGQVLKVNGSDYKISHLRKKPTGDLFHFPNIPDIADTPKTEIKAVLPNPTVHGSTTRQNSFYKFEVDLSHLNIR